MDDKDALVANEQVAESAQSCAICESTCYTRLFKEKFICHHCVEAVKQNELTELF